MSPPCPSPVIKQYGERSVYDSAWVAKCYEIGIGLDGKVLTIQVSSPSLWQSSGTSFVIAPRFLVVAVEMASISLVTVPLHALAVLGFLVGGADVVSASLLMAAVAAFFLEAGSFFLVAEDPPGAFLFTAVLVVFLAAAGFLVVVVEVVFDLPFAVALSTFSMTAVTVVVGSSPFA